MPVQRGEAPLVEHPQVAEFQVLQLYHTIFRIRWVRAAGLFCSAK